jgi:hypothetical protein
MVCALASRILNLGSRRRNVAGSLAPEVESLPLPATGRANGHETMTVQHPETDRANAAAMTEVRR